MSPAAQSTEVQLEPYKGLTFFTETDAPIFFGRDSERRIIAANLLAARLTLVYGESGVGKSSLLRAGVVHDLRQRAETNLADRGSRGFLPIVFSDWRDDPVVGLDACIAEQAAALNGARRPPRSRNLDDLLSGWAKHLGVTLLLVLDQFEEYFLYHDTDDAEDSFAAGLARAVARTDVRVRFLISIREDAWAKLDRFEGRIPNLFENYLRVEHLDREAGRQAIERPIEYLNETADPMGERFTVEPELVEAVLDQVAAGQVVLAHSGTGGVEGATADGDERVETPFLQLVLERLWREEQRAGGRALRLATLKRLGGAGKIVLTHLDEAMEALDADGQDTAARLFRHLVTPSRTKIAHLPSDLAALEGLEERDVRDVLERLSALRILRPVAPPPGARESRYEIFHDKLADAVLDWRTRFSERRRHTEEQQEFERRLEEQQAEATAAELRARRERQSARRLRAVALACLALAVGVAVVAAWAVQQNREAQDERERARASEVAARALVELDTDPARALRDALEGTRVQTAESRNVLREAIRHANLRGVLDHGPARLGAVVSPNGRFVATGDGSGTVRLWDASRIAKLAQTDLHRGRVENLTFDTSGRVLATTSRLDRRIQLWRVTAAGLRPTQRLTIAKVSDIAFSGDIPPSRLVVARVEAPAIVFERHGTRFRRARTLERFEGRLADYSPEDISAVSIDPRDPKRVVTAGTDGAARVWNAETGDQVLYLVPRTRRGTPDPETPGLKDVHYSPNGRLIVTIGQGTVARVWDARTGKRTGLLAHRAEVTSAAFSADSRRVVTTSDDGTARVWHGRTGRQAALLGGHTDTVVSASFGPGRLVVTAGADETARIWNAATGVAVAELRGHTDRVSWAGFADRARTIVTASDDGTVRLWRAPGADAAWRPHSQAITQAVFTRGRSVSAAGDDGSVSVSSLTGRLRHRLGDLVPLSPFGGAAAVLSTDGRLAAIVGDSNPDAAVPGELEAQNPDVSVYRVASRSRLETFAPRGTENVRSLTFSRSGRYLAVWYDSERFEVRRIGDAKPLRSFRTRQDFHSEPFAASPVFGPVFSPVFSPGDRYLAILVSGRVRLWEWRGHPKRLNLLRPKRGSGLSVAIGATYSPDGRVIVTFHEEGPARIWDVRTRKLLRVLPSQADMRFGRFDPSSRLLVTVGAENAARVWNARTGKRIASLRGHSGPIRSVEFSDDGSLVVTAAEDGTARVWNARTGALWAELWQGHAFAATTAVFAPDGRHVFVGDERGEARIYECAFCAGAELRNVARQLLPVTVR